MDVADLATIRDGWDRAAREDAMFNILTVPNYAGGGWPEDAFFAHGREEIAQMFARLEDLGLRGEGRGSALDFGCGVGRLTQALAAEYEQVRGVDVSKEMITLARKYNQAGARCKYRVTKDRLRDAFKAGNFDLIYSMLVLQHMPTELQQGYVGEFIELLAPEGLAVFEIPDGPDYVHPNAWLSMYGTARETVEQWVTDSGGRILDVELLPDPSMWQCYRYTAGRA